MTFRYSRYDYNGYSERILCIGECGENILFIPAMFAENNRLRALTVAIMRRLAQTGYQCVLPDLPGTLESKAALSRQNFEDWERSLATAIAGQPVHIVAIRGGSLLGQNLATRSRWHFAPSGGDRLMRELFRARQAALREHGVSSTLAQIEADCAANVVEIAGEKLSPALTTSLKTAKPVEITKLRTVRLASDPANADLHIEGPALWRRSEPENDGMLAMALADDIAVWISA